MDFGMEAGIFVAYAVGLLAIYFLGRLFILPIKTIAKLLLNGIVGGVVLVIINLIGGNFGIFLPVNIITALITGILGIPGTVGMLIFFNLQSLL
ncbi:MAG: pro-sigmaK processing inhibitor BofA [Clostridiales bacterium]|nr:pro-sigmaK processing inhibitor BofA [Clostridiales bacterium]